MTDSSSQRRRDTFAHVLLQDALAVAGKVHLGIALQPERHESLLIGPRGGPRPGPRKAPEAQDPARPEHVLLGGLAEGAGLQSEVVRWESQAEVIDIWFAPQRAKKGALGGLLGRTAAWPGIFMSFPRELSTIDYTEALSKALRLHALRVGEHKKKGKKGPSSTRAWLFAMECEDDILAGFGLEPKLSWPPGVYFSAPAFGLGVVVLSELERSADTILPRLLGAGQVWHDAFEELRALPADSMEQRLARRACSTLGVVSDSTWTG